MTMIRQVPSFERKKAGDHVGGAINCKKCLRATSSSSDMMQEVFHTQKTKNIYLK